MITERKIEGPFIFQRKQTADLGAQFSTIGTFHIIMQRYCMKFKVVLMYTVQ